jgi:ferredoxin
MAQIFHPSMKVVAKASIVAAVIIIAALSTVAVLMYRSSYYTTAQEPREQAVPFSHKHHVSGLGIDCRYCHTSVEQSSFAGIPPTSTCMTCHSQVWTGSPMLAPVRESYRTNTPLQWTRVNDLPDFVFFNHSIHIAKGIGCQTCHGQVDQMPLTWRQESLYMAWCLDCHRAPEKFIRPRSEVFNMKYKAPANQTEVGLKLVKAYSVKTKQLTDCSICHR